MLTAAGVRALACHNYTQAERVRELALIRAEEEEKLATTLAKRQHDRDRKDKELQHLREQSAELRE